MTFWDKVASALSLKPITAGIDGTALGSPWADSSHLAQITIDQLYGYAEAMPLTRHRAMRLAPVSKARRVIATNIGRLPLTAAGKDGKPLANQPAIIGQPETGITRSTSLTWLADSLIFYPAAWWQITRRDAEGRPAAVRWVPEGEADVNAAGQLTGAFGHACRPDDGIRFDSPDAGLLCDGRDTLRRAIRLNRAAALAEDNPVPSLDIHNDGDELTDDEINTLLKSWTNARQTSGVGYSSRSLKVTPLGQPPEQLLIDGRKAITLELARHIGVPAWTIDAPIEGTSLNYSNAASRNRELIDTALSPYMTAITDRLSMDDITPHGTTVSFDTDALTRPEKQARYTTYQVGLDAGFLTVADVREAEGLAPIPEPTDKDEK